MAQSKTTGKHTVTGLQQNYYLASYYGAKQNLPIVGQPNFSPIVNFGPIVQTRDVLVPSYDTIETKLRTQLSNLSSIDRELILGSYLQGCVYSD